MFWALVHKELLSLFRDAHGLAALFLMPVIFIVIMSLALKNIYDPPLDALTYAVDRQDDGEMATKLMDAWVKDHGDPVELPDKWRDGVRKGQLDYVILIEKSFSERIIAETPKAEPCVRLFAKPQIETSVYNLNKVNLSLILNQLRSEALFKTSRAKEFVPPGAPNPNTAVELGTDGLLEAERLSASARPTSVQQNVPAWLMFGMFFVAGSIANLFIQERESGTLSRLTSLGVPAWSILWSKAVAYVLVNALQAAAMLAIGVWVMPKIGGDPLSLGGVDWAAFVMVLGSISSAAVGLGLMVASLSRTHAQAAGVGPTLNILMGGIGGVMVPTFVMPEVMQKISAYSPMNWGLNGMHAVMLNGQGISGVMPMAGRLFGFGLVTVLVAMLVLKRR
jgi:ABC-2 type transport system permease protein